MYLLLTLSTFWYRGGEKRPEDKAGRNKRGSEREEEKSPKSHKQIIWISSFCSLPSGICVWHGSRFWGSYTYLAGQSPWSHRCYCLMGDTDDKPVVQYGKLQRNQLVQLLTEMLPSFSAGLALSQPRGSSHLCIFLRKRGHLWNTFVSLWTDRFLL